MQLTIKTLIQLCLISDRIPRTRPGKELRATKTTLQIAQWPTEQVYRTVYLLIKMLVEMLIQMKFLLIWSRSESLIRYRSCMHRVKSLKLPISLTRECLRIHTSTRSPTLNSTSTHSWIQETTTIRVIDKQQHQISRIDKTVIRRWLWDLMDSGVGSNS